VAEFEGSGQNSIQAIATDSRGNILVAGTTSSPDFAVKNAAQPAFGDARIMRTTDLGVTWTRVGTPPQDVNVVVPDPTTPQVLFAGGNTGIYKSVDGGATWRLVHPFLSLYGFSGALAIDPGNHLRVAAIEPFTGKVMRSVDGGENWTAGGLACSISNCQGQLLADPTGSGALLVSSFGLYLSRDWGLTFQSLQPLGLGSGSVAAFDPSHPGWIYAGTAAGVTGSLSLSTDFGVTWVSKSSPPNNFSAILNLAVDPDQPNTLVAATPDAFYVSVDGAATWTREASNGGSFLPEGHLAFAVLSHRCAPAGGLFALGSAGAGSFGVAFSPDYGATWKTPQLTGVSSLTAGANCAVYITRPLTSDAFVAKVAPDGTVLWATYLGGSDRDAAVALAVDDQDNVYVAGNTSSPDFPSTVTRIGVAGQDAAWLAKLSANGRVVYSAVVSGEAHNTVSAIAVDVNRNAYIAGHTNSTQFPVTPGTLPVTLDPGSYTGFLFKLGPDASLLYATYLGPAYTFPSAIIVDTGEEVTIAGNSQTVSASLVKLDRTASRVIAAADLPGFGTPTALAADDQGNLLVAGRADRGTNFVTPGAFAAPQSLSTCPAKFSTNGDAYIGKFSANDWKPVYGALLRAACGIQPGAIAVDQSGAAVLAMAAGGGLPLRNPLLAGPACGANSSAVARLSPDGSSLEFATYLDNCGVPGIALAEGGSLYAGVSPLPSGHAAAVVNLNSTKASILTLDGIANAFSGDASAVVVGGLYTVAAPGLQTPVIAGGLNPKQDLPTSLGGVEVLFDRVPAPILQSSPGKLTVVAPVPPPDRWRSHLVPGFTAVQIVAQGVSSNIVWMPVADSQPGLLTAAFLNPQPPVNSDGYAHNQDGTVNDASHPAAAGSTITLYVTGMGTTIPPSVPGSIAHSTVAVPVTPVYATWKRYNLPVPPDPETVYTLPGYLSAALQIPMLVPPVETLGGVADANGVRHVLVGLQFQLAPSTSFPPASNLVGVYVK
jgi:uncharacterized protein (TIGR03437 family)